MRLFDRRLPPADAKVLTLREHSAWVLGVYLRKTNESPTKLITGSVSGDIRLFDLRRNSSNNSLQTMQGITSFVVHESADLFACSTNHNISTYNILGRHLNSIKFHEGFMNSRIGTVNCLNFHPHRVILGAGSVDGTITAYASEYRR